MPAPSWPMIAGKRPSGSAPEIVNSSVWQMPVALISTSTSPALGPSRSTSMISSGLAFSTATAARVFMRCTSFRRGVRPSGSDTYLSPILHERRFACHAIIERARRRIGLLRHPVDARALAAVGFSVDGLDQGPAHTPLPPSRIDEQVLQIAVPAAAPGRTVEQHVRETDGNVCVV